MAFSLESERPATAAVIFHPFRAVLAWFADRRDRRARQKAFAHLLDLENAMLDDLGIDGSDVLAALEDPRLAGRTLTARRARRADDWLSP